ncbi:hypothetical protein N9O41_01480 [Crocinitomicaceae bacterium]|jgi:hypothetical protein|nr:hypothetical protein [Crocinitomicaceae bacterium]
MKAKAKKFFKWFSIVCAALLVFLSVALYLLQDKIISTAIGELNKNLEVPMRVDRVEFAFWSSFPNISIDLLDVKIPGRLKKTNLLTSEKFNLRFNPLDLLNGDYNLKQINITKGSLNLIVDSLGRENFDIIKDSDDGNDSDFRLALQAVRLKEMDVRYQNEVTHQDYRSYVNLVSLSGELSTKKFDMLTEGNIQMLELTSSGMSLIKDQLLDFNLKLSIDKAKEETKIPKAIINIGGLPFEIDGFIDADSLLFNITSKSIQLTDAVDKLTLKDSKETLNAFQGEGLLDFDLKMYGGNSSSDPLNINCLFSITNGQLREPIENIKLSNIQLKGHYIKEDLEAEELVLENISLVSETGPFKGALSIVDFTNPKWTGSAKGKINLKSAHRIFKFPVLDEVNGFLKVSTDFVAAQNVKSKRMVLERCNGDVNFENVTLKLKEDKRQFEKVNGKLEFTKQNIQINNFSLLVNASDLSLSGRMSNVFNYLYNEEVLGIDARLKASKILITDLGSTSKEQKKMQQKTFALPKNIKGKLMVDIQNLNYEKHDYENVKGSLSIQGRDLNFKQISLDNSGSKIKGSLRIKETEPERFDMMIRGKSNAIKIQTAFLEWDNFYQDVLLAENISGDAALELSFHGIFDLQTGLEYPSIDSRMVLGISNGNIRNAGIMNDIAKSVKDSPAKYILGKKNLNLLEERLKNVAFESLTNTITIKNSMVTIPKMEISSSVLDMNVSGTHSFENEIDYRFDFKFRDLLNSEKDSEFGEVIDDGTGIRLFLKMYGDLDDPILEWDKEQKKKSAQEYRQEEKKQIKEMLKTEFGAFKNDTTVQEYIPEEKSKEDIKINWEPTTNYLEIKDSSIQKSEKPVSEKPKKKTSKLKQALEKLKEQQQKETESSEEKIGIKGGG